MQSLLQIHDLNAVNVVIKNGWNDFIFIDFAQMRPVKNTQVGFLRCIVRPAIKLSLQWGWGGGGDKITNYCRFFSSKIFTFKETKRNKNSSLYLRPKTSPHLLIWHTFFISVPVKGIVSPDWKGLQMISLDRFEV
jgi:hypothetical protein